MERKSNVVAATPLSFLGTTVKPKDCPGMVLKLMNARKLALEAYPNSPHFQSKITLIDGLKFTARRLMNEHPVTICNRILELQNDFLRVAPSESSRLRKSYMDKLRLIITACENFRSLKNRRND